MARSRRVAALLFCGVLALACAATAGSAKRPKPYRNPTVGRDLVYQIRGMHLAKVRRGIVYRNADGLALRMDVYHPRRWDGRSPLPALVIGGPSAYAAGRTSGQKVGWSQLAAASGFAAATFDIRSDNELSTPRDPSEDVAAAIAYIRAHAAELGIDGDRLCTLGFSLGTAPWHLWAAMRDRPSYIRCNVVYYGALDFHGGGFAIDPSLVDEFSALTYLRRDGAAIAPMLVVKAGRDQFREINASIDRFMAEARTRGAPVQLLVHPTAPHGFDVGVANRRGREIVKRTLAFLRSRLS